MTTRRRFTGEFQGEGSAGSTARRQDDPGDRGPAQGPPEPGECLEAASGGGDEAQGYDPARPSRAQLEPTMPLAVPLSR